jgi:type I restriction enzyme S subunit
MPNKTSKTPKSFLKAICRGVWWFDKLTNQTGRLGREEVGEIFEIKPSKKEAKDKLSETDLVSFLPMEDLGVCENEIKATKEKQFKEVAGSYTYFAENDVLLAKITPCFENGKLGVAKNLKNGVGFGSSEYIVFRCPENIAPEFLFYFLSRESLRTIGKKYMSGAVGHKRVSKDWIENYLFSYPKSKEEQRTIIRQLDALRAETQKLEAVYQKKLDDLEELKKIHFAKGFCGGIGN